MGYKTKDGKEVMALQAKGYSVIGMKQIVEKNIGYIDGKEVINTTIVPGLEYEFNFEEKKEEVKPVEKIEIKQTENTSVSVPNVVKKEIVVKPAVKKKAGRPTKKR